jgi:cadherin EGF LAG seven-pass G-type receptor 1
LPFAIDEKSGWLTTTEALDREVQSSYQFGIEASDHGTPRRSEKATVIIQIQDRNDNDPVFQSKTYEARVSEKDPPGTTVLNVLALDRDENARVHYEITGGNARNRFSITTQSAQGVISIAQPLDYQQEKRFLLTVSATDSGGRFDTATVYVSYTGYFFQYFTVSKGPRGV